MDVDVDELGPEVTAARIALASPAGTQQVTARLADGLALAITAGAPVRVADAVMDRVAVPVAGGDLLSPLLDRVPPVGQVRPGHSPAGWPVGTLPGQRTRHGVRLEPSRVVNKLPRHIPAKPSHFPPSSSGSACGMW